MKKQTKVLVLILSVALVLAGLVLAVSADTSAAKIGNTEYATLAEAVTAANAVTDGTTTTITLTSDVTLDATIAFGEVNVVLDLNGHKFTSTAAQAITVNKTNFTLRGTGTVTVEGALIYDSCTTASTGKTVNIGSDDGIITVTHNATVKCNSSNYYAIRTGSGNWTLKNLKITTAYTSTNAIRVDAATTAINIAGVELKGTQKINGSNALIRFDYAGTKIDVRNSKFDSTGAAAFYVVSNYENDIIMDNIYVNVPYYNGDSTLFSGYATMKNDIIISNSYLSYNQKIQIKFNTNNSALVLKNTILYQNGTNGGPIRSMNVKLEEGSAIISHSTKGMDTQIYTNYDNYVGGTSAPANVTPFVFGDLNKVNMVIYEGARFDKITYQKIVNPIGTKSDGTTKITYYADGQIVYEDGTKPTESTTYKIVYRPNEFEQAPYVVVKASEPDVTVPTYAFSSTNPTAHTTWNGNGNVGNLNNSNLTKYWQYRATMANTSSPTYLFGISGASGSSSGFLSQSKYDVLVFDIDIASDTLNGFTPFNFGLHSRKFNTSGKDEGGCQVELFSISRDGTVTLRTRVTGGNAPQKLTLGEWHHITMVVDTQPTKGKLHLYIDGIYVGSSEAYSADDSTLDARLSGPRFDVTGAKTDKNTLILVDNVAVRAFGSGTATSPITDKGVSYLINGGNAWNTGKAYGNTLSNSFGYSVADIDTALDMNSYVKLNSDVELPQTVTKEGVILANGKNVVLSGNSISAAATRDSSGAKVAYMFGDEYDSVNYKFFTGDHRSASQLANEENYVSLKVVVGDIPTSQYIEKALGITISYKFLPDSNNHYRNCAPNGWSTVKGNMNPETFTAVTAAFASENNGEAVIVYPTYDIANGTRNNYALMILDTDGIPRKYKIKEDKGYDYGTTDAALYGSHLRAFDVAYGETVVFQKNVTLIASLTTMWSGSTGNSENKVINIDLSGCTVTFNNNNAQTSLVTKGDFITVLPGETLNLYSSVPGGKITTYGVSAVTEETTVVYPAGAELPAAGVTAEGYVLTTVTHTANEDGTTSVTTKVQTLTPSGGRLVVVSGGAKTIEGNLKGEETNFNTHVNIGTVNINGKTIPGSNVSFDVNTLLDATSGDSTCTVNIDGVYVNRISNDYSSVVIVRRYCGDIRVTNSTIVCGTAGSIITGHAEGITDKNDPNSVRALATVSFDNCVMILNSNDGYVVGDNYSFKSLTFTNCTTNSRLNPSKLGGVVIVGNGNKYYSTTAATKANGIVEAGWNNPMTINGDVITVSYIELIPDNTYKTSASDFNIVTYTLVSNGYNYEAAEGETVVYLPILACASVPSTDVFDVKYTNLTNGKVETKKYAKGGTFTLNSALEEGATVGGEFISGIFTGWNLNGVAAEALTVTVTENLEFTPVYENVSYTFAGTLTNLSLATDFSINFYIPIEYKAYVTSITENDVTLTAAEFDRDNDGNADYLQVTVTRASIGATDDATFTINLKDGLLTATETATVSLASYADAILSGNYTDANKTLMYYMLNYANEAEKYFLKASNANLEALMAKYTGANVEINHNYVALDTSSFSGVFADATVVLESAPAFKFTFANTVAGTVEIYHLGANGEKINAKTYEVNAENNVVTHSVKAYNFDKTLYIDLTNGDEITTYTYNYATFAAYHTAQANAGNAASYAVLDLIEALYDYAKVAYMYKAETLG